MNDRPTREKDLRALKNRHSCPVLIVGGGIVGIGTFRELALRGIPVILVEGNDYCSGASGASSRLLHGGLRYLEQGEFRLVQEALRERDLLLTQAPHATRPLAIHIPILSRWAGFWSAPLRFVGWGGPATGRGSLLVKIGLSFYDFYTRKRRQLPPHRFLNREQALQQRPELNPEIRATAVYYDAWMPQPERIALDLLRDARSMQADALALNYVSVQQSSGAEVCLRDCLSGEEFSLQPRVVVNAGGAWIDSANERLGENTSFIGGTKGSHLVLRNEEIHDALQGDMIYFEHRDGRILLCYPFYDQVLVGTTDIRIRHPDQAICTEEEVEYLLDALRWLFPGLKIQVEDIVFRTCGVRPLPSAAGREGEISRDHDLQILPPTAERPFPIASLIGGKWTNFRAFSESAARWVLQQLQLEFRSSSEPLAIGGGRDYPLSEAEQTRWIEELAQETGHEPRWLTRWLSRYGTHCKLLAHKIPPEEAKSLEHLEDYARGEISELVQQEQVCHLDDLLLRRTLIAMRGSLSHELLVEIAQITAEALGWDAPRTERELARAQKILRERHAVMI
ncbi:MAG: glycerol-3-phosphate dehydrogenase/oxidase [Anaerolineaceae bacterium]|nr:glycerol-3-phosphate dehydrogenase/oxidase [Anaerolineaceae bacterium]